MPSPELIKAVAVTAELCGRVFSEAAAEVFVSDLSSYPEPQVLGALVRCRKEVRGMLTLADVVSRLADGRPGAEEAWAMIPKREAESGVWTDEMSKAYGLVASMIDAGEMVPARMAFKEAYLRLVGVARDAAKPVNWTVTLGFDPRSRSTALVEAIAQGFIGYEYARGFVPDLPPPSSIRIKSLQ